MDTVLIFLATSSDHKKTPNKQKQLQEQQKQPTTPHPLDLNAISSIFLPSIMLFFWNFWKIHFPKINMESFSTSHKKFLGYATELKTSMKQVGSLHQQAAIDQLITYFTHNLDQKHLNILFTN